MYLGSFTLVRHMRESVATHGIREKIILSYQTFVTFPSLSYLLTLCCFINFCHLINLSSFYQASVIFLPFVIYAPYKCTCCTPHKHNSLSCLIVRTLSAPIHFPNSTCVFGHSAILIWGDRDMAGGFLEEQPVTFKSNVLTRFSELTSLLPDS